MGRVDGWLLPGLHPAVVRKSGRICSKFLLVLEVGEEPARSRKPPVGPALRGRAEKEALLPL